MADYDLYSDIQPVLGTDAGVAFDGTASLTPSADTEAAKSVTAVAVMDVAVAWEDMTIAFEESDDDVSFADAPAESVLFRKPVDETATTRVFHAAYIGKKRYVKAKGTTTLTTETGQITFVLGHLYSNPFDQQEIEE